MKKKTFVNEKLEKKIFGKHWRRDERLLTRMGIASVRI